MTSLASLSTDRKRSREQVYLATPALLSPISVELKLWRCCLELLNIKLELNAQYQIVARCSTLISDIKYIVQDQKIDIQWTLRIRNRISLILPNRCKEILHEIALSTFSKNLKMNASFLKLKHIAPQFFVDMF
jgi:hypothetical protein